MKRLGVIEQVKSICFSVNVDGGEKLHREVLGKLKKMFVKGGYRVRLEYPICYESIVRKSGERVYRDGNIDLVAEKGGRRIAIEFDDGICIRFKSLEKLLQVDAELCIGIIRGRVGASDVNSRRVKQCKEELCFAKKFWLIILSEKAAYGI